MWTIVIFLEENTIEIVPVKWIVNEHMLCYWPDEKNHLGSRINNCEVPGENWRVFKIRFPKGVHKNFSKYLLVCLYAENIIF